MNLKKYIGHLILFTLILSIANCKTAQVVPLDDFSFLNGEWIKPCDSLLAGAYKGELECVMLEEDAIQHTISLNGNQGFVVRELPSTKDTTYVAFKYDNDGRLMLENRFQNKSWLQGVYQVDSTTLKLYAKDSSAIRLFKRKS